MPGRFLIFKKIKFLWQKPKVVVVINNDRELIKKFIGRILGSSFKIDKEVLFSDNIKKIDLSTIEYLILNIDDVRVKKFKEEALTRILTFGFQESADFRASDIQETSFKINYKGNIVPVWLEKHFNEEQICAVLVAISIGVVSGLNLVEISQALGSRQNINSFLQEK